MLKQLYLAFELLICPLMMIKPESSNVTLVAKPCLKKNWNNGPALVLISRSNVNAKIHPSILENTGSPFTYSGNQYVTNNASLSFKGTINEAAS
jgi:hypothetical protein